MPCNSFSMHRGSKIRYWINQSIGILLLILFLGYYGSITLFSHSHIVNGVTIVHSHPFKTNKGGETSNPPHTEKELLLIQLLSELITTAFTISFATLLLRSLWHEIPVVTIIAGYTESGGYCNYSLRAPPYKISYSDLK